jgi:hypothetical protein
MSISLTQIQSSWGGPTPIQLENYYQGGSLIGPNVRGGSSIPSSGAIGMNAFSTALNQYSWSSGAYINGDQNNDGQGYNLCYYYNPVSGKYCLTFVLGAMSQTFGPTGSELQYATSSSSMPNYQLVYAVPLTTIGTTVYTTGGNNIKGGTYWQGFFPGGWIANATLNSNNTVSLNYNSGASSGDSGTNYALARQRDAWNAMFGSYSPTVSVSV